MPISVIIPTYKSPEMLDLCLRSCILGQQNKNQIIVVVDGFYDLNKEVLEKYKEDIEVLNLEENVGLCRGTNLGVYNAKYNDILIVNDDNVFCNDWDWELESLGAPGIVWSVNQIEPYPSIFPQFKIKNLGTDPKTFDLFEFNKYVDSLHTLPDGNCGSTLPIFMKKVDYLKIGGWDENYPTNGMVCDWDFFLKCNLNGYKMFRTRNLWFYHFTSASVNGEKRQAAEHQGHIYAIYKWGSPIKHNSLNNLKYL